jgi:hypothetical protein
MRLYRQEEEEEEEEEVLCVMKNCSQALSRKAQALHSGCILFES